MKILMTGHKGFLGKAVDHKLSVTDDFQLTCFSESNLDDFVMEIEKLSEDVFDLILHIGAVSNPQEQTTRLWQMNVAATEILANTFSTGTNRCLFVSSYSVYNPDTDYGWTKLCAERILKSYFPEKNLCIVRPVSIFGGDQLHKETPSIIDKFRKGELTYLFSNWYRDFVHVDDVVRFIVNQSSGYYWHHGTFDLGTGEAIACSDFAEYPHQFGISGYDVPLIREHAHPSSRVADPKMFPPGWRPNLTIRDVMEGRAQLYVD